jgi:Bacterial Ig-like domain (group 2)
VRRARRILRLGWVPVMALIVSCDLLLTEPRPATTDIGVSFQIEGEPIGGPAEAFSKVTRVFLRLARPDSTLRDTVIAVTPIDGVVRAGVSLQTDEQIDSLRIVARLGYGTAANPVALFEGTAIVRIEPGVPTSAEIALAPIPAVLVPDRTALVIPNVGETAQLGSAVLFASSDTVPGLEGTWLSEDPSIISVTPAGLATAQQIGRTRLELRYDTLADTIAAVVSSVDNGTVMPADTTVFRGSVVQYSAVFRDVLGNVLTGRTVTWATSDPAVTTIDANGLVTADAPGSVVI